MAPKEARASHRRRSSRASMPCWRKPRAAGSFAKAPQVAIVGAPNVGKSSLFNALLNANRAIVTAIPGTTRDLLTERADIGGLSLSLIDTAGVRETADVVEQEGVAARASDARASRTWPSCCSIDRGRSDDDDRERARRRRQPTARGCVEQDRPASRHCRSSRWIPSKPWRFRPRRVPASTTLIAAIATTLGTRASHCAINRRSPTCVTSSCSNAPAHRSSAPPPRSRTKCPKSFRCSISRKPRRAAGNHRPTHDATICCVTSSSVSASGSNGSRDHRSRCG